MTVFKAFLKVLNKCKGVIILYTLILLVFGAFSTIESNKSMNFVASKPDVAIVNEDENSKLAESLVEYLGENANIQEPKNLDDALFYRELNYIIYIPESFGSNFLKGDKPQIEIKSTGDYQASLAEMLLERYLKTATVYRDSGLTETDIVKTTEETLAKSSEIELTSKLDSTTLSKATTFYNFANYALLAGAIYVISLIISSFKETNVRKRTIVSGMDYKKYNRILLLSNGIFAILLWAFYCLLSIILIGKVMFTTHGLLYILNSFLFTICTLAIAMLISNVVANKDAINGIVNVVALGSSFLCGSFVPMEWLPEGVLKVAHILPSYYYVKSNEIIKTLEDFNVSSLKPIFINMIAIVIFIIIFSTLSNIISKNKRKIN